MLDSLIRYEAYVINKHDPEHSCTSLMPCDEGSPLRDKILDADLVVQCGAPVYWNLGDAPGHKCATAEWVQPLWYERIARISEHVPVVNVAAGACQGYFGNAAEIIADQDCVAFMRRIHSFCRLTTVRDTMAQTANAMLGLPVVLQPCASIHAWLRHRPIPASRRAIALNFMPLAGHYDLEQRIVPERWAGQFVELESALRRAGADVVLIAHDRAELTAMQNLLPGRDVYYSADYNDYFPVYARCGAGIVNRVHAAMLLAGNGVPAIVIGNDSRSRMVDELGLVRVHVSEVNVPEIAASVLAQYASSELPQRLQRVQETSFEQLRSLCRDVLSCCR